MFFFTQNELFQFATVVARFLKLVIVSGFGEFGVVFSLCVEGTAYDPQQPLLSNPVVEQKMQRIAKQQQDAAAAQRLTNWISGGFL